MSTHPIMKRLLHYSLQFENIAYSLLLAGAAIALYLLAAFFPLHWDVTRNANNSLSASSVDTLKQMPGKISITMYANSKDAELGDIEHLVRDFIGIYQRHKADISLTFVDPVKDAEAMRNARIRTSREMVVEYGGRSEHLTLLNHPGASSIDNRTEESQPGGRWMSEGGEPSIGTSRSTRTSGRGIDSSRPHE